MTKPIEEGCLAEIKGSLTVPDGTIVRVMFKIPDENWWIIDQEFPGQLGTMTNKCYGDYLHRIPDDEGKELCTDWVDVMLTTGWAPPELLEEV